MNAREVARSSFGAHLSVAGGLERALEEAGRLRMGCVQVFTKNQRQWRVKPLVDHEIDAWRAALRALGWTRSRGRARVVSHNSYLINLASPDPDADTRLTAHAWRVMLGSALMAAAGLSVFVISGAWLEDEFGVSTGGLGIIAMTFGAIELGRADS